MTRISKDDYIELLQDQVKDARQTGALEALRGLLHLQSAIGAEYGWHGSAAEFHAAERVIEETATMIEVIASA